MDSQLDRFFNNATRWKAESAKLREVLRECELTEEFKWGKACYVALMFFKGALLKDPAGVLEKPG